MRLQQMLATGAVVAIGCGGADGNRGSASAAATIGSISVGSGGGSEESGTGDADAVGTEHSTGTNAPDTEADDEGTKFDMGPQPDASLGCDGGGGGGGTPDFSFIWIANSDESTVSKIDTTTLVEQGRYITRPDQEGNPSRTSVNLNGDAVIANRNGGATMIFARHDDCPDSANTSSGPADVKPWPDGCVAWHTPMVYESQRPVAWTAGTYDEGTCRWQDAKVWTSGANNSIDVLLLDGETGVVEQTVPVGGVDVNFYGIYGAAVDSGDHFWGLSAHDDKLVRIDRVGFDVKVWDTPVGGYGMAVDRNDRVWTCAGQVGRFDYGTQTWQTAPAGGAGGCMPDGGDLIWLANDPMVAVDIVTLAVVQELDVPHYVHGVSIDFDGNVWGPAIGNDEAYRVNPATGQVDIVTGLNHPYTYSDMTGFGLSQVGGPSG